MTSGKWRPFCLCLNVFMPTYTLRIMAADDKGKRGAMGHLIIKVPSCHQRASHHEYEDASTPSHLYNEDPYTWKDSLFIEIGPGASAVIILTYCQTSNIRCTKSQNLVSSCSCLCPIYWSQALSLEWRCSWSNADRRCSNYICVINNLIASGATYIRGLRLVLCKYFPRYDDGIMKITIWSVSLRMSVACCSSFSVSVCSWRTRACRKRSFSSSGMSSSRSWK